MKKQWWCVVGKLFCFVGTEKLLFKRDFIFGFFCLLLYPAFTLFKSLNSKKVKEKPYKVVVYLLHEAKI